jgi:hypothetical protein
MYYFIILQRSDEEITKRVVMCQKESRRKGDFFVQTKENMDYLHICESDMEGSKTQLKETLIKNTKQKAFEYLIEKAKNHSKVNEKLYSDCEGLDHYNDGRFRPDLINILFKFRTRMFLVKNNFRSNYTNNDTLCPVCHDQEDTQEHLFECKKIMDCHNGTKQFQYNDIFSNDCDKLLGIATLLRELVDIRNGILNPE